jgi:hypothetical protein
MEYHGSATTTAMIVTDVDGRVRGGLMVVCEFAGKEFSPEGGRKSHYSIDYICWDMSNHNYICCVFCCGCGRK